MKIYKVLRLLHSPIWVEGAKEGHFVSCPDYQSSYLEKLNKDSIQLIVQFKLPVGRSIPAITSLRSLLSHLKSIEAIVLTGKKPYDSTKLIDAIKLLEGLNRLGKEV